MRLLSKRKGILSVALLVAAYAAAGFWLAPYMTRQLVTGYVEKTLERQIVIGEIRIHPFLLRMDVDGLNLSEKDQSPILSFDRFRIDLSLSSLNRLAWIVSNVDFEGLEVNVDIDPDRGVNLARLVSDIQPQAGPGEEEMRGGDAGEHRPLKFMVESLRLSAGRLRVSDRTDPTPAQAVIEPIDIEVHHLTTLPDEGGSDVLSARLPEGGVIKVQGDIRLQPVASTGRVSLSGLKTGALWAFFQDELNLRKPEGDISLDAAYHFAIREGGPELVFTDIVYEAKDVAITLGDASEPALVLSRLSIIGGRWEPFAIRYDLGKVTIADGRLNFMVDGDGNLNWSEIGAEDGPRQESDSVAKGLPPDIHVSIDQLALERIAFYHRDESRPQPLHAGLESLDANLAGSFSRINGQVDARVSLDRLTGNGFSLQWTEDRQTLAELPAFELTAGEMDLGQRAFSLAGIVVREGRFVLERDEQGRWNWARAFAGADDAKSMEPSEPPEGAGSRTLPWTFALDEVNLIDHRLLFADRRVSMDRPFLLQDIRLHLTDVGTDRERPIGFRLTAASAEGGGITADGKAMIFEPSADFNLAVNQLNLTPAQPYLSTSARLRIDSGTLSFVGDGVFDAKESEPFRLTGNLLLDQLQLTPANGDRPLVGWRSLKTERISLNGAGPGLLAEQILLTGPYGDLHIAEDGSTNWGGLMIADSKAAAEKEDSEPFPYRIRRIAVQDGRLNFSDASLPSPFAADLHGLKGTVSGVAADPATKIRLAFEGQVQEHGSASITGTLKPSAPEEASEVTMAFRNIEMTELTPYTEQFAGRDIASGRLSLDLSYKVNEGRLQGDNRIVMDQVELGPRVESPTAMDLPLELALALLKDADGRVDIGLPVSGNLEDPDFSYGSLIWKALADLFKKIVSAPFAALAGMFGAEHENLDTVAFPAGSSEIPPPEAEKLSFLARSLSDRPSLRLGVMGTYHPELDGLAMREDALRRKILQATGIRLSPEEKPGAMDFLDPAIQRAIVSLSLGNPEPAGGDADYRGSVASGPDSTESASNPAGAAPEESIKVLYQRLLEATTVDESQLRALAERRAKSIVDLIASKDRIDNSRLVIAGLQIGASNDSGAVISTMDLGVQ
ncbi:MAG: DUF748 domain-containing protein [Desulfobacteraceae bacterium]|nr:DUF748 domain-containing protein [Desulfobacteraceae bacterium]